MTPTRYRAGGANEEIRFAVGETSLGAILVASSERGLRRFFSATTPTSWSTTFRNADLKARTGVRADDRASSVVGEK